MSNRAGDLWDLTRGWDQPIARHRPTGAVSNSTECKSVTMRAAHCLGGAMLDLSDRVPWRRSFLGRCGPFALARGCVVSSAVALATAARRGNVLIRQPGEWRLAGDSSSLHDVCALSGLCLARLLRSMGGGLLWMS